jgi:hypothetical protein
LTNIGPVSRRKLFKNAKNELVPLKTLLEQRKQKYCTKQYFPGDKPLTPPKMNWRILTKEAQKHCMDLLVARSRPGRCGGREWGSNGESLPSLLSYFAYFLFRLRLFNPRVYYSTATLFEIVL